MGWTADDVLACRKLLDRRARVQAAARRLRETFQRRTGVTYALA